MKNVLAKTLMNSNKIPSNKSKKIMSTKNSHTHETKPDKVNNIAYSLTDTGNIDIIESTRSQFSLNGLKRNSNLSEISNESSGQHQIKVIVRFRPYNESEQVKTLSYRKERRNALML
jgi:hypothetical protein